MQQLRNSTKWIMILVALAFVGLMVFEWGMDISGRSAGSMGEIGRVNGTPVSYETWQAAYRSLYEQTASFQEEPITSAQNSQIEDDAWDQVVTSILIEQELERRGIVVTVDELRNAALFSPPPDLMGNPAFLTDGQFDITRYQTWVSTAPPDMLQQLEAVYREIIPRGKLARQLGSGVHVSDRELWDIYRQEHETASASFVAFEPLSRVADDRIEIAADEVSDYYRDNRESFFIAASATVVSTHINKAPTPADTAAVLARAGEIRESILEGEDFAEVAASESAGPAAAAGGDLGVVRSGDLLPALDSVVFGDPPGRVSEPIATSFGIHLLEVTERWSGDSARVRRIQLDFVRTDESEFALFTMADSLEELAESMPLAEAAALVGLDADTVDIIETRPFIPGAGDIAEGGEWVFDPETSQGEASPVFENRVAFYALELVSFDPERYQTEAEAESAIRGFIGVDKRIEAAGEEAREFVEEVRTGRSLSEVAREFALEVRDAGPFTRNQFVPGLGRFNAAVGAAFGLDVGEVSDVVEANQNVFVIERTASQPADSVAWVEQLEVQRRQELLVTRQTRLGLWIEALREAADIVDRREQVLRPADDGQQVAGTLWQ